MQVRNASLLLLTASVVAGCSSGHSHNYFPLSESARWEYSVEILAPGQQFHGKIRRRVDGRERINGKEYFKVVSVTSGIPGIEPETNYFRTSAEGVYILSGQDINGGEQLYLPADVDIGASWNVQTPGSDLDFAVEGIETAELFDMSYPECLKVRIGGTVRPEGSENLKTQGVSHFAPSVGEVRTSLTMTNSWGAKVVMSTTLDKFEK